MRTFFIRNKAIISLLLRLVTAALLLLVILDNYHTLSNLDIRALIAAASGAATTVLLVLGVYMLKSIVFVIPASLIYIYVGMAFSKPAALLINAGGILLEVICSYWLGRLLGGAYVSRLLEGKKFHTALERLRSKYQTWAMLLIRALPIFPIDLISLLLGAYREPFRRYVFLSLIGILPRVVLFTLLGDGIYKYIPMRQLVFILICAVPLLCIYWIIRFLRRKKHKDTEGPSGAE